MLSANWGMQIAGMAFQTCSISDEKYFLNKTHSAIIYKNTSYILTEIPFSLRYLFKSIISNSLKWNKEAAYNCNFISLCKFHNKFPFIPADFKIICNPKIFIKFPKACSKNALCKLGYADCRNGLSNMLYIG